MSKWPYIATIADGTKVTPLEAKEILACDPSYIFYILGIEVFPKCGAVNAPHWASTDLTDYLTLRPGYEMSEWHYNQQVAAHDNGFEVEYKIVGNNNRYYFADAYDKATNTVYEYVWSCFDTAKIEAYFDLGYNQVWILASDKWTKKEYEWRYLADRMWQYKHTDDIKELVPEIDLPTIHGWIL